MEDNNKNMNNEEKDEMMREENIVEEINEEVSSEMLVEDTLDNFVENDKIEVKEVIEKEENKKANNGFLHNLMVGIIDQTVVLAVSLAILFVFDFGIRFVGFKVVDRVGIYFIIYVLANILYSPILKATKLKQTIGSKVLNK